ncbi:hypothetical protein K1W54_11700 [Micromonospora sp. CPCC 205371]|nr:hypothetical protein [Micromonospora sp. CPCC 205371]
MTTPRTDAAVYAMWISAVHQAARETGATVAAGVEHPTVGRNHYRIRMTTADGTRLRLLLNAAALLVAAADDTDPDAVTTAFWTVPGSDLFTDAGLHVAEPAELERPLTDRDATALTPGECKDITYHRPARIGDALFNWFD